MDEEEKGVVDCRCGCGVCWVVDVGGDSGGGAYINGMHTYLIRATLETRSERSYRLATMCAFTAAVGRYSSYN